MRPVVAVESIDLAAAPDDVWPLVADTDRSNRLLGMAEVAFTPVDEGNKSAARFVGSTRAGGFRVVYEEAPFEWVRGRTFAVERRMQGGPLESYTYKVTLQRLKEGELAGGTRLTVTLELYPRHWILRPLALLNARQVVSNFARLGEQIDAYVRETAPNPFREPIGPSDAHMIEQGLELLRKEGVSAAIVDKIGEMLRGAPDADLVRMRPFEVASHWKIDRLDVLRAMLKGVPAGLFELRWGIICPSCRTASEQSDSLADISAQGHCQLCDIHFDLDLDRAVEATFSPHPTVRRVPKQMFCIGGPARTPHVVVQAIVEGSKTRVLDAPEESGRYRLFSRGGAAASLQVEEGAPATAKVSLREGKLSATEVRVAPGGGVEVENETEEGRHLKIERLEWASDAATAHVVANIPEFRRIFSCQLLKRGTRLKVQRVAILFSDLTGSTALYSRVGDATAFRLVDDHFDLLRAAIENNRGVVVKTMGDAIMAAFTDPNECVRAALEALERFEEFRASVEHGSLIGLKLGMHAGACYVVTANGALDYFGQTVNVASRVQHLAGAGEIVLGKEHWNALRPSERGLLETVEEFSQSVKGVDVPLQLVRARLAPGVSVTKAKEAKATA